MDSNDRIAVLIDADNTSHKWAEPVLEELAKYGIPTIKRAYGDFTSTHLSGWTRELNARAIRAIHQNAFTTRKNSTDSALIIDAMDLLYAGNVEAFAIVSSDSDFTGLALRLRESGKTVYGLGNKRTPQSLQNACDKFIQLEVLGESEGDSGEEEGEPASEVDESPKLNLQSVLSKAVNATADDEGWSSLSAIGNHLNRAHPSFDPRSFGHAKLSSLVTAQGYLETADSGSATRIRLKGKGTPARKSTQKAAQAASQKTDQKSAQAADQKPAQKQPRKRAAKKAADKPADKAPDKAGSETGTD